MNEFNNREIALFIWIGILIIWLIAKPSSREDLFRLVKSFFGTNLLFIYLSMVVYVTIIIYSMYRFKIWDISQLKNTIMWVVAVGSVALFHITDKGKSNYFKLTIKDILRFTVISEFIVGIYSFSLGVELVLLPLTILIFGVSYIAERKDEHEFLARPLKNILGIIGLIIIGYAIYKIITDFSHFATKETLSDFLIPPLLSILFLPYVYVLSLYVNREDVFISIDRVIKDPGLIRYAKLKTLLHFHFNKNDLKRWRKAIFKRNMNTRKGIDDSIKLIKELKKTEKHPPHVFEDIGWSPYKAKNFLSEQGIMTGYYEPDYEGEWFSCSPHIEIDDETLLNNLAYYVTGSRSVASKLQLVLNMNSPKNISVAHLKLLTASKLLYQSALKKKMPQIIEQAIKTASNKYIEDAGKKISIVKNVTPNHSNQGYEVEFTIQV